MEFGWMEGGEISESELERLTDLVMCRLQLQLEKNSGNKTKYETEVKKRLLVMGELTGEEHEALSRSYRIESDTGSCNWEVLLIAELSLETMAYAAQGIFGNQEASCILKGLLKNKKIFLLQRGLAYRSYRERASKNLYSLYLKQEDAMRNLGVECILYASDMEKYMHSLPVHAKAPNTQNAKAFSQGEWESRCRDFTNQALVREADLSQLRNAGITAIKLNRDAKITPLAMDFITNHKLKVIRG